MRAKSFLIGFCTAILIIILTGWNIGSVNSGQKWISLDLSQLYEGIKNRLERRNQEEHSPASQVSEQFVSQTYREIETQLTMDDIYPKPIANEVERLKESGVHFWHDADNIITSREEMLYLETKVECDRSKGNTNADCSIVGLQVYKKNAPPDFQLGACDDTHGIEQCLITEPKPPIALVNSLAHAECYGFDKDIYMIGPSKTHTRDSQTYSIFKNSEELFSRDMFFGGNGAVTDASMVLDAPAFTFYDFKKWEDENTPIVQQNTWYHGETFNEKFDLGGSSHIFAYRNKIGFVAQGGGDDEKKFFMFNDEKISQEFDEIRTHTCCDAFAYPIEIDSNGVLFFLARRGEKYFFVEVKLDAYLEEKEENSPSNANKAGNE